MVATLHTGLEQDRLKGVILVVESWWCASCLWVLKTEDCLVKMEDGLLSNEPSFCRLTSVGANRTPALQKTPSSDGL